MAGLLTWLWWRRGADPVLAWVGAISLMTFLAYVYDKWAACVRRGRVAEQDLLVLALLGGTVAAYLSMKLFRHKTAKRPFRIQLGLVVCIQAGLIAVWLFRHRLWPQLPF